MPTIADIRQQYPQYSDMSDIQLADALHGKHYSDMPKEDFYSKIGLQGQSESSLPQEQPFIEQPPETKGLKGIWEDIKSVPGKLPGLVVEGSVGAINSANQGISDPARAATNLVGGIPQGAVDLVNLPFAINSAVQQYGARKGFGISEEDRQLHPELNIGAPRARSSLVDVDIPAAIRKMLGMSPETQEGDLGWQMVAPGGFGGAKIGKGISQRLDAPHVKAMNKLKEHLDTVGMSFDDADRLLKEAESSAVRDPDVGVKSPDVIERKIAENERKMEALRTKTGELPPEPVAPDEPLYIDDKALELEFNKFSESADDADRLLKETESSAVRDPDVGVKSPDVIERKIAENERKMEALRTKTGELPPEPVAPIEPSGIDDVETLSSESKNFKDKLERQKGIISEIDSSTRAHLGEGQLHHERFGTRLQENQIAKYEAPNKADYAKLDEALNNMEVKLPPGESAKDIADKIRAEIQKGNYDTPEIQELSKQYESALENKTDTVTGRELLGMYRTARDARLAAVDDMRLNPSDEGRMSAKKRADLLSVEEKKLESLLHESMDIETKQLFDKAQSTFRDKIVPLRFNSLYKEIKKTGKVKGDILEKLVGSEHGLNLIQDLVGEDQELMRLAVGQKHSSKPSDLLKPNELLDRYLPNMPELKGMLDSYSSELEKLKGHQQAFDDAKAFDTEKINRGKSLVGDIKSQYKQELAEYNKSKNAYEKMAAEQAKASDEILRLKTENQVKSEKLKELKARADNKNQTLKQKIESQKKYDEAKSLNDELKSQYNKKLSEYNKAKGQYEQATAEKDKAHEEIARLHAKNEVSSEKLKELKARADKKNQTLAQKIEAQKKYDEAVADFEKRKGRIRKLIKKFGFGVGGATMYDIGKKIWKNI